MSAPSSAEAGLIMAGSINISSPPQAVLGFVSRQPRALVGHLAGYCGADRARGGDYCAEGANTRQPFRAPRAWRRLRRREATSPRPCSGEISQSRGGASAAQRCPPAWISAKGKHVIAIFDKVDHEGMWPRPADVSEEIGELFALLVFTHLKLVPLSTDRYCWRLTRRRPHLAGDGERGSICTEAVIPATSTTPSGT